MSDHSDHHGDAHGDSHSNHDAHGGHAVDAEIVHGHGDNHGHSAAPLAISPFTDALVKTWKERAHRSTITANKLSVSQTVSFLAFMYEKLRNAVEFREEHLVRRAAIERIIKRRMLLNGNGRSIADLLIKELLWARYYENNTIGEERVKEVQAIIDKYFFLRNEMAVGRGNGEQEEINRFILSALSCEIEEHISPDEHREAFINYSYQVIRSHVAFTEETDPVVCDIQTYIAIHRTLAHNDDPVISYQLLKLMIPDITSVSWKTSDQVLQKLYDVYREIQKHLAHPLRDKVRNVVRKHIPPFLILRDIFEQNAGTIDTILTDEGKLKQKVDETCRKRYDESRKRLRRTAVRSFIYILLTKVLLAFAIEIPYDLYVQGHISYAPIAINVFFPPMLMGLIVLTVTVPGDDNTRRIYEQIKSIIDKDPDGPGQLKTKVKIGGKGVARSFLYHLIFGSIYLAMYLISFGSIVWVLMYLNFNPAAMSIFLLFLTLVLFFTYRVVQISKEYQVVDRDSFMTPLVDFFFIPFIKVGQWLSGEVLSRFNVLIFILDMLIELPFKAIAEVIEEWVHFVKLKKEEIV